MSDGHHLSYDLDGLQQGANLSYRSSDEAEDTAGYLRTVSAGPKSFGGAAAFTSALSTTRDEQLRGVRRAGEDRDGMGADSDHMASVGDQLDVDTTVIATRTPASTRIADAI